MAKTYVISGGNSGIGLEAGRQLGREGHKVILLGRDPRKAASAMGGLQIANYHYAKELAAKEPSIKVGVCNVGLVKTEIMRDMPGALKVLFLVAAPIVTIPVEKAAANPVWLSTHSEW